MISEWGGNDRKPNINQIYVIAMGEWNFLIICYVWSLYTLIEYYELLVDFSALFVSYLMRHHTQNTHSIQDPCEYTLLLCYVVDA